MKGIEVGFAPVNGTQLYYQTTGEGHPLVLIHAGIADQRMWDEQINVLAQRYKVVRYDVRGHGKSKMPPGAFSNCADLLALLKFLEIGKTYLVGLSMGGSIAIDFTLQHPQMVDGLVAVSSGLSGFKPAAASAQQWHEIEAAFESGDTARAVELEVRMWVDGPLRKPGAVHPRVRERVRQMETDNLAVYNAQGTPQPLDPPAIARLAEIRVPTLVIVGAADVPSVLEIADVLATGIKGARRAVFPGVAHMINMEKPKEFNQEVLGFLMEL